ncbi:MCE family protein [Mycolicibacterium vaccae]|uniref:MCE family protein n=1 Tax=Mycolicibacterium vaccae TaxID=1810 RepID=UPI003CE86B85
MKMFEERNPYLVAAAGVAIVVVGVVAATQYRHLPFVHNTAQHSAYFAEAGGIAVGSDVQVLGYQAGQVTSIKLDGPQVLVTFDVDRSFGLGDRSEAAIKTKSVLGTKMLELTPRGSGELRGPIPLARTTSPYQLPDALGDLASTISGLDTIQLSDSLTALSETFAETPPDLRVAVAGVARLSRTLNDRDAQLRQLLANAEKATTVLALRSEAIAGLVRNGNALLAELQRETAALDSISGNVSRLSRELSGFVAEQKDHLRPALEKVNGVLTIVDDRKEKVQESLKLLNAYMLSLGESVSSGPFFKAYLGNLLPGQFIQPFVDAAFSDLGLDPATLLPSELFDPQVGQAPTPAMPVPFPRTGQGGEPRLTLPDAITGNPGDPRYPYREPPPAPEPGGPPPGPPAVPHGSAEAP